MVSTAGRLSSPELRRLPRGAVSNEGHCWGPASSMPFSLSKAFRMRAATIPNLASTEAHLRPYRLPARCGVTFRFGPFSVDPLTRQLLRGGQEVSLSPKAFQLLLLLVETRSRAMSKNELQQQLWPSTFVLDTNLAGLIAEIRRALGDTAEEPTFVRTMHRFGYRFIGDVQEVADSRISGEPVAKYWLVWENKQVPLSEGENIVGRGVDASVWIDAPGVSRHHARIVVREGTANPFTRISGPLFSPAAFGKAKSLIGAKMEAFTPKK